jgi:class 3 adenylate cyclase
MQRDRHGRQPGARLCGEAGGAQILISTRILSKIENQIDVEPLGELSLKGFSRPVPAYNVVGVRARVR